ncbi:hypothetical protein [Cryobacterium sp. CG_9.6]|uniref:hypothetical protein n=1 Tax=Cryobacterium sp. CG_9.6 TaxID=2760710 RepID=UPI0024748004|nr:hypothetical protein [Cryobacterium sp. CG_9.6]MDH6235944.1 hypothetical protein [Cryobacterium sp. CG_9.6]
MNIKRVLGAILAAVLGATLLVAVSPPLEAKAANSALFDPGNIISDAVFFDGSALTAGSVQAFLEERVKTCRSGYTCLKDYRQDTPSKAAVAGRCAAYSGRVGERAADIITRVGNACGISQKAMLVLLEKEQGIVTDTWPSSRQYRSATGYGCPDTADCDANFYGFFNQVYAAALQFQYYAANPTRWNHIPGRVNSVRFHPNSACGSSSVFIQNQATAGLYNYTPYQPNAAALSNLYGTGDSCSSYGNRNFWRLFSDWFGDPTTGTSLLRTNSNATVYLISGSNKFPVTSLSVLGSLSPLGKLGYVSQSYLDNFKTGAPVGRAIRDSSGTIFFFDAGIKLPFPSCALAQDYGASCAVDGYTQITDQQANMFQSGPVMTSVLGTVEGSRYYIKSGEKAEILDAQSQALAGISSQMNVLTENAVAALILTKPIIRDGVFARSRSTGSSFLLANSQRYAIDAESETAFGVTPRISGSLTSPSLLRIPLATAPFAGVVQASASVRTLSSDGSRQLTGGGLTVSPIAVPQSLISTYVAQPLIAPGAFIKSPGDGTVYVVMPTDIRPISGWDALEALSPDREPVIATIPSQVIDVLKSGPVALRAGTLVRSPSNATVYFVNGVTNRIALSDFNFPNEAGFKEFSYSTEERIQAYPLGAVNMTFGVSCGVDTFVSAGGAVHAVAPDLRALYPFAFVSMDSFTCALMTQGASASNLIRTPDGSIYHLVAGQKRPITSSTRLNELRVGDNWLNVLPAFAAAIPTGPTA